MTDAQEAAHAVALGVEAIGMILHADSPRVIDPQSAKAIRNVVPDYVKLVGVFVDANPELIERYSADIGLDLIQLHGSETNELGRTLSLPFIKAIRAKTAQQVSADAQVYPDACALLIDPYVKGQHGGTGQKLEANLWPTASKQRLVLAGGLSASNVVQACSETQPFAIDLNSGIEISPGHKDMRSLAAALAALRSS